MSEKLSKENKDWVQGWDAGFKKGNEEGYCQGLRDAARKEQEEDKNERI